MPQSLAPSTLLRRRQGLVSTQVDDETVLLNISQGFYYGLNLTGSRIWDLLEEPLPLATLIERLEQEYDIDTTSCAADLKPFILELLEEELLETAS